MSLGTRSALLGLLLVLWTSGCSDAKNSTSSAAGGNAGTPASAGNSGTSPSAGAGTGATLSQGGSSGSGGSGGPGGMTNGGSGNAGASTAAGAAGAAGMAGVSGTGGGNSVEPAVHKDGESKLSSAGLAVVSYGGYLNGEAFQQDGIVTYKGYQYTAFWNTAHHVVMARRALPSSAWTSFEFTDYTNTEGDAHNTISLGITGADGTLHVAFDHHGSPLHYRKSHAGLLSDPANATWSAASFDATTSSLVAGTNVADVTYPRFISEPGGDKTLFSARLGSSGSGDEYLWEYSASTHAWTSLGKYLDGIVDNINAYLHGLVYEPGGTRLHASWCWRDTPDASTNHGLLYLYSDDNGRTWRNNAGASVGTSGTTAVRSSSSGIEVWNIKQNRGLINQEAMLVDAAGRVHVLLSHMPDAQADDATFDSARSKSQSFHYWRDLDGKWTRSSLGLPVVAGSRGKLALSSSGNLYAILPDLRIAGASLSSGFKTWALLEHADEARFFSDPLVDTARLLSEDKLSVVYQEKSSSNIYVLDYTLQ